MHAAHFDCDIFCTVVDNYGDIGVCWRLTRILANEHHLAVRLWVDDVASFAQLCPAADAALDVQMHSGVEVRRWRKIFSDVQPADIVIAAFACKLPESYLAAMADLQHSPAWINLEYLSAEAWVEGCHRLPSPHPRLPLTQYFFFPGFTQKTGGLLREHDLLARRDAFLADVVAQQNFWRDLGVATPADDALKVSLFAYENPALPALFDAWANGAQAVLCLVPQGRIVAQVTQYFSNAEQFGEQYFVRGNLQVRVIPFVAQEQYDTLLWACDVNFVRGEDSCVRAQWAGKPLMWQIYPQHDAVHLQKLSALWILYSASLPEPLRAAAWQLWSAWNGQGALPDWTELAAQRGAWQQSAQDWSRMLEGNDLALNLLDFCQKVGTIRAFKIEGQ